MMYLLKLKPEDIQVIFLESMSLNDDPFYDLYKNVISRGGEPIYIKNLKKKYHISFGIHVPINWDSPCFILSYFPNCANPTKTYKFYNYLIDKYMNLPNFTDSFITDNETYYYPKTVIDCHNSGINFTKTITFQWRRPWPKGRKTKQYRMLVNSIELVEKLSLYLPKNILLRMVNTASLPISKQIALMKKTDYLIGIHGAGLYLSVFLPEQTILHELLPAPNMIVFQIISILSGHKSYYDIIKSEITNSNDSEEIKFDENEFITKVLKRLKDNNFL